MRSHLPTLDYEPAEKASARLVWRFVRRVVMTLLALALVGAVLAGLLSALFAPFLSHP
jgi:hypothetical protein